MASFRVLVKGTELAVANAMPAARNLCENFTRDFAGTIGSNVGVKMRLTAQGSDLSGTEQYERAGGTLRLKGRIDSFGNFILNEQYPEGHMTGVFKGTFSQGCNEFAGYFSKPDRSRLLPFELKANPPAGN